MDERTRLSALNGIATLQDTLVQAARSELSHADRELEAAGEKRDRCQDARESAFAFWQDGLAGKRPDPGLVAISRDWLIRQDAQLAGAQLAEDIARSERERRAEKYARQQAIREITADITKSLQRRVDRADEERRLLELGDALLRRRIA